MSFERRGRVNEPVPISEWAVYLVGQNDVLNDDDCLKAFDPLMQAIGDVSLGGQYEFDIRSGITIAVPIAWAERLEEICKRADIHLRRVDLG